MRNGIRKRILSHEPVVNETRLTAEIDLVPRTGFAQKIELLTGNCRSDLFRAGARPGTNRSLGGAAVRDDGDLRSGRDILQYLDDNVLMLDLMGPARSANLDGQRADFGQARDLGAPGLTAINGVLDGVTFALRHGSGHLVLLAVVHEGAAFSGQRGGRIRIGIGLRVERADFHIPIVHIADFRTKLDLIPRAFLGDHAVLFALSSCADLFRAGGSPGADRCFLDASVGDDGDLCALWRSLGDLQRHFLMVQDDVVLAGAYLDLQLAGVLEAGLGGSPALAIVSGVFHYESFPVFDGDSHLVIQTIIQEQAAFHRQGDVIWSGDLSGLHIAGRICDARKGAADAHILCNCIGSQRTDHRIGVACLLVHIDHAGCLIPDVLVFRCNTVPYEQGRNQRKDHDRCQQQRDRFFHCVFSPFQTQHIVISQIGLNFMNII